MKTKTPFFPKKICLINTIISLCVLLVFSSSVNAGPVLSTPFTCEAKFYQSIAKKLMLLDPDTGTYNQIGASASAKYNAIGWDRRTNFIYGYRKATKRLFKLGTSGLTADLGKPKEVSTGQSLQASSHSADMDDNGNLWIYDNKTPRSLFKINVDTNKYTKIDFVGVAPKSPNDIVYIASTDSFWGVEKPTNKLIRFNISTHTITSENVTDLPVGSGYGAAWTNVHDELYVARNSGGIYRIDDYSTDNPIAIRVLDSIATNSNDGASCPVAPSIIITDPSTGDGTLRFADSGGGEYKDRILFMDWKDSSLEDGMQDGDIVNFTIPASSCMASGTLTATFSDIDDPGNIAGHIKPTDMKTWDGSGFYKLYDTDGVGEALYTTTYILKDDEDSSNFGFTVDWNLEIDGEIRSPDIFLIDAESTTGGEEQIDATTNGGAWSVVENAQSNDYEVDGLGSLEVSITNTEHPEPYEVEGWSPLLLSKGMTRTIIDIKNFSSAPGKEGVAFALLAPCDRGDAPASYGDAGHAFLEEAISDSKEELGLKFTPGTPYFGSTPPDSESALQEDASPAQGDDNNNDAYDTERNDDEDIEVPQLAVGRSIDITVPVNGTGYLNVWFDWNADNDFGEENEQVVTNLSVDTGNITLTLNVPANAEIGNSFARFRISTQQDLLSTGYAKDGEVEDVAIEIIESNVCSVNDLADSLYPTSSVSANSSALSDLTLVYQAKFNSANWEGHVMAYNLETTDNDGSVKSFQWDAADVLSRTGRKIFTYNPSLASDRGRIFKWGHLNNQQKSILRDGDSINKAKKLLNWVKGANNHEGSLFRGRTKILGDIVNSNLLFKDNLANYGYSRLPEGGAYNGFLSSKQSTVAAIFVGANDGMLHAFNASNGEELFGFVPNEIFPKLVTISDLDYGCKGDECLPHEYLVDGKSALGDVYFSSSSDWHTVLVGGLGKGGKGLFALDVTHAESFTEDDVLWEISSTQAPDSASEYTDHLGETIPLASVVRLNNSDSSKRWAAIVGNGYGANSHQAVLFIIDIETGALIKKINTGSGTEEHPNGLSTPIAVDSNNDSIVDRIYAGDLLGNLWAFDVSGTNPDNWEVDFSGTPLFTTTNPITAPPQAGRHPKGGLMVYVGTGKYFDISDNLSTDLIPIPNTYFGIHDNGSPVAIDTLVEQTILQEEAVDGTGYSARVISDHSVDYNTQHGWFMTLPTSGERVISQALLRQGRLIFTTMTPPLNVCAWGGTSWLMEFDAVEGKRLDDIPIDLNNDKKFTSQDNVLYQGNETIISGVQDASLGVVFSTPAVINHDTRTEGKYLNGTGGSIGMLRESAGGMTGRMSWRLIK